MFEVTGKNPLLDIALELERIALEDDYFVKRKLYPNVDFYSGLIYQAMGFPVEMFPVLFAIPRTAGWLAQWEEMLTDPEQKIARPRQIYVGSAERDYVPVEAADRSRHAPAHRPVRATRLGVDAGPGGRQPAGTAAAAAVAQTRPGARGRERLQRHARPGRRAPSWWPSGRASPACPARPRRATTSPRSSRRPA